MKSEVVMFMTVICFRLKMLIPHRPKSESSRPRLGPYIVKQRPKDQLRRLMAIDYKFDCIVRAPWIERLDLRVNLVNYGIDQRIVIFQRGPKQAKRLRFV